MLVHSCHIVGTLVTARASTLFKGALPFCIALLSAITAGRELQGQTMLRLDDFAPCSQCRLIPVLDIRLGNSGPGLIENRNAWASYDEKNGLYVVVTGRTKLAVFDRRGHFLNDIHVTREGSDSGGTIRAIAFVGDAIVVMDVGRLQWVLLRSDGRIMSEYPMHNGADDFTAVGPDTVVTAAMLLSPNAVGWPLHLQLISTGASLRRFGSSDGHFNVSAPWAKRVLLHPAPASRSVWLAKPSRLRFEEWSLTGKRLQVAEGSPAWFPPILRLPSSDAEPPTRMRDFAVDSAGRLWVLSRVSGKDWSQAAARQEGREQIINTDAYFDTRIDVFDLRRRLYYGTLRWNADRMRLITRDGDVLLQVVESGERSKPSLALYRLEIGSLMEDTRHDIKNKHPQYPGDRRNGEHESARWSEKSR